MNSSLSSTPVHPPSDIDQADIREAFGEGSTFLPFPPAPDMSPAEHDADNDGWWEHMTAYIDQLGAPSNDEPPPMTTGMSLSSRHARGSVGTAGHSTKTWASVESSGA
jgi:hypothetical protein